MVCAKCADSVTNMVHKSTSVGINPAAVWQLVYAFACDYDSGSATIENFVVQVSLCLTSV